MVAEHNKNKPCITTYTPTNISRVLSECDTHMSIYDNDPDMKSVKENFDRQTSQRFEQYEERMMKNRKKYKEQRDKDIQKIILKDKVEKSLEEKVEKVCLRCGCGLGGVAAGVGIFGSLGTYGWKVGATTTAYETAKQAGIQAGIEAAIAKIKGNPTFESIWTVGWSNIINRSNYNSIPGLVDAAESAMVSIGKPCPSNASERVCSAISANRDYWLGQVAQAGEQAASAKITAVEFDELAKTVYKHIVTYIFKNFYIK
ncbi:rifin [Plasmodium falciparum IGH-CR14]|uniref:Rifin n=1 Tax=Plasmodium falciparum IGH-CR14 TaxID=580059 RepID=A0A0L1I4T3_PLAFA|nr:rifin [Plasmodium falciparum IGH-CR14]